MYVPSSSIYFNIFAGTVIFVINLEEKNMSRKL